MTEQYAAWVARHVPGTGRGRCKHFASEMARDFPALKLRKGLFTDSNRHRHQHWWCVDTEASLIVDPTAKQFPGGRLIGDPENYLDLSKVSEEEAIRRDYVPAGKCIYCGTPWYYSENPRAGSTCSDECAEAMRRELA